MRLSWSALLLYALGSSQVVSALSSGSVAVARASHGVDGVSGAIQDTFELRHVFYGHGHGQHDRPVVLNVSGHKSSPLTDDNGRVEPLAALKAGSRPIAMARRAREANGVTLNNGHSQESGNDLLHWVTETASAPDTTDRETIINLARMTSDAYSIDPSQPDWLNVTNGFNSSSGFGWNDTGLRGQIFANLDNSTVIIAYKGTSVDPRDVWAPSDKLNDNLLFSCCCATQRPDPYWYGKVCDCRMDTYKCNATCLTTELLGNKTYYPTALDVYFNVTKLYPDARIWTTGHSMGGAVASLVGLTFNIPAVSFESPPQALAAQRLGLAVHPDPRLHGAYHFGNTADPVFMGACNGWSSACAIAGLAFESQCFTGQMCAYDTVTDKGWRSSIVNHRINYVIKNVLEAYDTVANCTADDDCVDCFEWYFD